jgi:hypothetical protein
LREKVKEKITEVKRDNGWNRERDVKERYENFIQIIKRKLGETTPKRKKQKQLRKWWTRKHKTTRVRMVEQRMR